MDNRFLSFTMGLAQKMPRKEGLVDTFMKHLEKILGQKESLGSSYCGQWVRIQLQWLQSLSLCSRLKDLVLLQLRSDPGSETSIYHVRGAIKINTCSARSSSSQASWWEAHTQALLPIPVYSWGSEPLMGQPRNITFI